MSTEEEQRLGIARDVNCLLDTDKNTRRRSLEQIKVRLIGGKAIQDGVSERVVLVAIVEQLIPGCLRVIENDGAERNRETSMEILEESMEFLHKKNDEDVPLCSVVEPILSCFARRMGNNVEATVEPSEEVRLRGMRAIEKCILKRCSGSDVLVTVAEEIVSITERGMKDSFHEIKKAACECAASASESGMFECNIEMPLKATKLLKACISGVLGHQHHRVRQAGLKSLCQILLRGGQGKGSPSSISIIQDDVIPNLSILVQDRQPIVRKTLCKIVGTWLRSDIIDVDGRVPLLPILISCLTDETVDVVKEAKLQIDEIGAIWPTSENEITRPSSATNMMDIDDLRPVSGALPSPYEDQLPSKDVQRMITSTLKRLLPTLLKGLNEWTVQLRMLYARQLKALLLLAGDGALSFLDLILPALTHSAGDDNHEIAEVAISSAHIIACTCPGRWVELAMDCVGEDKSVSHQTSSLSVIAALLYRSSAECFSKIDFERIGKALSAADIRGNNNSNLRLQLLVVMQNLMLLRSKDFLDPSISKDLFSILLQLCGDENNDVITRGANVVLQQFAGQYNDDDENLNGVGVLFSLHAATLLSNALASDDEWTSSSPDFQIFKQILVVCPSEILVEILPIALPTMYKCAGENRDPSLRISILKLIDSVAERKDAHLAQGISQALLQLCMLAAVWKAGKTAAAIRYAAIIAMGTLVKNKICRLETLRNLIAATNVDKAEPCLLPTILTCMDEDFYTDTRRASCYLCEQILLAAGQDAFTDEQRRQIYPALLKRLDDSSDDVRISACSVFIAFFSSLSSDYDDTNTGYLLKGMLIHMDDANPSVQEAVCQAAIQAAIVKREVVFTAVEEARKKHRSTKYCDRVLATNA